MFVKILEGSCKAFVGLLGPGFEKVFETATGYSKLQPLNPKP